MNYSIDNDVTDSDVYRDDEIITLLHAISWIGAIVFAGLAIGIACGMGITAYA